jgi:hypothetical protein
MNSFTWQDVLNHLQSFTPEQLNHCVEVNVSGGDYMTLSGISTETETQYGESHSFPVLEY